MIKSFIECDTTLFVFNIFVSYTTSTIANLVLNIKETCTFIYMN